MRLNATPLKCIPSPYSIHIFLYNTLTNWNHSTERP